MNSESIFMELKTVIDQRNLSPQTYESYRAGWKTACWYFSQLEHLRDHPKNISKQDIIEFLAWVGKERSISKELQCFWAMRFWLRFLRNLCIFIQDELCFLCFIDASRFVEPCSLIRA